MEFCPYPSRRRVDRADELALLEWQHRLLRNGFLELDVDEVVRHRVAAGAEPSDVQKDSTSEAPEIGPSAEVLLRDQEEHKPDSGREQLGVLDSNATQSVDGCGNKWSVLRASYPLRAAGNYLSSENSKPSSY